MGDVQRWHHYIQGLCLSWSYHGWCWYVRCHMCWVNYKTRGWVQPTTCDCVSAVMMKGKTGHGHEPWDFHFYSMCPPSTKNTHWQLLSAEPLHYCTVAVDNNPRPRTHIIMGTPMPNKFLFFWPGLESNIVFPTTPGHLIQFLLDEISWDK